ncbi:MAG TPA: MarR family transcriptional regulator [Nevskiaceae bacterium]|nr:MarR family transcriptional regulator [Nevskiaceae bacterium]
MHPPKTAAKHAPSELDRRFFALVRELFWRMRAEADARLEPLGLSNALWRPLLLLQGREGPITQADMARELGIESPTVVRLLDRLGAAGLVERCACPHDRRAWHVELTPQGRSLCARIEDVLVGLRREMLLDVKPAALKSAVDTLGTIVAGRVAASAVTAAPAKKPARKRRDAR